MAHISEKELMELCLSLIRYKKENKELVTYLLYEKHDEPYFIEKLCIDIDEMFAEIEGLSSREYRPGFLMPGRPQIANSHFEAVLVTGTPQGGDERWLAPGLSPVPAESLVDVMKVVRHGLPGL